MAVTFPTDRLALAVRATRPLYLPTSLLPGLLGVLVALGVSHADWWIAPLALVALLLLHAGTNVINDVEDCARGVDDADKVDNSRVFTTGLMSLDGGRRLAAMLFGGAFAIGVVIAAVQQPALLIIGIAGLLAGWGYSAGPVPLKYAGLGDATIVLAMGPLLTQGAYTAVTGDAFHAPAFWIGLAPGLLITAVLAGNNLSDLDGDRAAGVRTLAVRIGAGPARRLYLGALGSAYVVVLAVWAAGLFGPAVLAPLLTAPIALARAAQSRPGSEALPMLAPATAQLHLVFTAILVVGVIADRA